jgi:hypothetical protein
MPFGWEKRFHLIWMKDRYYFGLRNDHEWIRNQENVIWSILIVPANIGRVRYPRGS